MIPERIDDAGDPRVVDFRGLTDLGLRTRIEPATGVFMAEGRLVIERALSAGLKPLAFFMEARWWESMSAGIGRHPAAHGVPVYVADGAVLRDVTGYRVHRGALATFARPAARDWETVVAGASRVLVLADLVDHTNVGAAFRSAAALGFDAVVISPRCADPLYRRSMKVSMGAVLSVPWARLGPWPAGLRQLRDREFSVLALAPRPVAGEVPHHDLADLPPALRRRPALVVGSEGPGLAAEVVALADASIGIPMAAGVDSLNAAGAVAVACYALGPAGVPRNPSGL